MASRQLTVDLAKKKKFLFILQMPKLRVPDAMKLAMFVGSFVGRAGSIDGGPSTKINNRKKYYVMALGGRQSQQPTKNMPPG
jgi:hypothetical protein